jgi:hypothetical protein
MKRFLIRGGRRSAELAAGSHATTIACGMIGCSLETIVKARNRMPAEGDDDRLLLARQHRRSWLHRSDPHVRN